MQYKALAGLTFYLIGSDGTWVEVSAQDFLPAPRAKPDR
jgi:hypothetical protein